MFASIGEDGSCKVFDVVNFGKLSGESPVIRRLTRLPLDMINMIDLGYTPAACCWVHKRGQARALLAVYVCSSGFILVLTVNRSEKGSSRIRIYDGRGANESLYTIDKLHKSTVHLIVVSVSASSCRTLLYRDSTPIYMTPSYLRTSLDLSNTGNPLSPTNHPRTTECGPSNLLQISTNSKNTVPPLLQ